MSTAVRTMTRVNSRVTTAIASPMVRICVVPNDTQQGAVGDTFEQAESVPAVGAEARKSHQTETA